MVEDKRTEADAIAEIATKYFKHEVIQVETPDDIMSPVVVLPRGMELHSCKRFADEWRTEPERRKGTAKVTDLASFIAHVNRFKDPNSAIFADPNPDAPRLLAVLNYHEQGPIAQAAPRFGDHRTEYAFPLSDEWKAWLKQNGEEMEQDDFAAFIEDRLADVGEPADAGEGATKLIAKLGGSLAAPHRLLELSRGLTVRVGARVAKHVNLSSGESTIQFEATHTDGSGQPLSVPSGFVLAIPVFKNGVLFSVPVRLRYRVRSGDIVWFYELYRTDRILDTAIKDACTEAKEHTACPLFMGTPE